MVLLGKEIKFPTVDMANREGILAFGGDLQPQRLLLAYRSGIFPWYNQGEPIIWYSPSDRMVLFPKELHISKSMRQVMRNTDFRITWDTAFEEVIYNCQRSLRKDQMGTWINEDMRKAYIELHKLGFAKSVEVWDKKELVGGLYGVDLGHVFCGESMFSKESNSSKLAFIHLVQALEKKNYQLIDCQVYNEHLASLGAREIPREEFMDILKG